MRASLVVLAVILVGSVAGAEEFQDYNSFRYVSGLPGGGYGVDADGDVGFDGALMLNVPVGYSLSSGNYSLAAHSAAINGGVELDLSGDDVNGTLTLGLGLGPAGNGLYLARMNTASANHGEPAYNAQYQVLSETAGRPAVSVGIQDIFDQRAKSSRDIFGAGGRSFYVVGTKQVGSGDHPAYVTLGFGNGRFNSRPFGGYSYQFSDRLKAAAEYDGWNCNLVGAWDAWSNDQWHAVVTAGLVDFDRCVLGVSATRTSGE